MEHQYEHPSALQDKLTGMLIGLARATENNDHLLTDSTAAIVAESLCAALTDAKDDALLRLVERVDEEKRKLVPDCYTCTSQCGRTSEYDMSNLWNADEDVRSLKLLILFGIRGMAARVYQAAQLGRKDHAIHKFLYKALFAIGMDDWGASELLPIILEAGEVNLKCMAMLDEAVPDLPVSMEQQEDVCMLLTLLHLGSKKIRVGSTLSAFISPNVQSLLEEKLGVSLITTS